MIRICLALLLLIASAWPVPAVADARASAAGVGDPGGIRAVASAPPAGALPAAGGWGLLRLPEPAVAERDVRTAGPGAVARGAELPEPRAAPCRVADGPAAAGVLRLRLEHLPYFATAPPASR